MSCFDEQPDGDPHGECAAEIHRLEQQRDELLTFAERIAALPMHGEYVALIDEARAAIAKATGGQP